MNRREAIRKTAGTVVAGAIGGKKLFGGPIAQASCAPAAPIAPPSEDTRSPKEIYEAQVKESIEGAMRSVVDPWSRHRKYVRGLPEDTLRQSVEVAKKAGMKVELVDVGPTTLTVVNGMPFGSY